MKTRANETYYDTLQLLYENERGEFFNGSVSIEVKQKVEDYINNLEKHEKDRFILYFIKHTFLSDAFIEIGASLEDITDLIEWLEYKFE